MPARAVELAERGRRRRRARPGPATTSGTGSPEWITSGEVGVAWSPVMQTTARSTGRSPSAASSASIVLLLDPRVLRVPGRVGRLDVGEDERVAGVEPLADEARRGARRSAGAIVGLGRVDAARARRRARGRAGRPTRRRTSRAGRAAPGRSGAGRGRPHHLSVITLKRSPSSRRCLEHLVRVQASAARAVRSASGSAAWGGAPGAGR